jgi:hypothetical protein
VSPVKYELGSCIPEDAILNGHLRENLKSYISRIVCVMCYSWEMEVNIGLDISFDNI